MKPPREGRLLWHFLSWLNIKAAENVGVSYSPTLRAAVAFPKIPVGLVLYPKRHFYPPDQAINVISLPLPGQIDTQLSKLSFAPKRKFYFRHRRVEEFQIFAHAHTSQEELATLIYFFILFYNKIKRERPPACLKAKRESQSPFETFLM